jgi:Arc/MetJ-type ribon-helix-helix transcriptional regulator
MDHHHKGIPFMAINVKLSEQLVAEAKRYGSIHHRSLPKQIEHWSQMGKIAEENPDLSFSMIQEILIVRAEEAREKFSFAKASDYIRDFIRQDQRRLQDLKTAITEGLESGRSPRKVEDVMKAAKARLKNG